MNTYKIFVILIMLTIISSCNCNTHEGISIQNYSSDTIVMKVYNESINWTMYSFFLSNKHHKEIEDFVIDSVTVSKTGPRIGETVRKPVFHNYNTKKLEKALTVGSTDSISYYRRNLKLLFHQNFFFKTSLNCSSSGANFSAGREEIKPPTGSST